MVGGSPTRPSLWAVLKNSIGKDLSKMALPIIFNEPLSALQRWAEDLEYAYLLDQAATATNDAVRARPSPAKTSRRAARLPGSDRRAPGAGVHRRNAAQERMALVSVFQISNYSSTMIRVYKPFNPILGETYECQRCVARPGALPGRPLRRQRGGRRRAGPWAVRPRQARARRRMAVHR